MNLDELRNEIDRVDSELVQLLIKRAHLAVKIGALKKKVSSPIQDSSRESRVIDRVRTLNDGPMTDESIVAIWRGIISACTKVQENTKLWRPDEE